MATDIDMFRAYRNLAVHWRRAQFSATELANIRAAYEAISRDLAAFVGLSANDAAIFRKAHDDLARELAAIVSALPRSQHRVRRPRRKQRPRFRTTRPAIDGFRLVDWPGPLGDD